MSKVAGAAFAAFVISVLGLSSVTSVLGASRADTSAQCRAEMQKTYPPGWGAGYGGVGDRARESAFDACMMNGGTMPQ